MRLNIRKSLLFWSMAISLVFTSCLGTKVVRAEGRMPVMAAVAMDESGIATLTLRASTDGSFQAYKLTVQYDKGMLRVAEGDASYGNYFDFQAAYTSKGKGICVNNHVEESGRVLFSGACSNEGNGAVAAGTNLVYVRFAALEGKELSLEECVAALHVTVDQLNDGTGDQAKQDPELYGKPLELTTEGQAPVNVMRGDADQNGKVNLSDASLVLRAALGIVSLDGTGKLAADADGNGTINLSDASLILKMALGIV